MKHSIRLHRCSKFSKECPLKLFKSEASHSLHAYSLSKVFTLLHLVSGVFVKRAPLTVQRRHHQIPPDQGERGGVAELHVCRLAEATRKPKGAGVTAMPANNFLASGGLCGRRAGSAASGEVYNHTDS